MKTWAFRTTTSLSSLYKLIRSTGHRGVRSLPLTQFTYTGAWFSEALICECQLCTVKGELPALFLPLQPASSWCRPWTACRGQPWRSAHRAQLLNPGGLIANSHWQPWTPEQNVHYLLHFWAPLKRARSFGVSPTSIIFAPAKSCMIRPEVTMGEMPSSIKVPWGKEARQPKWAWKNKHC